MKRRVLSLMMAIVMLVSLFSIPSFAQEMENNVSKAEDLKILGYGYNVASGQELNRINLAGFPILDMSDKSWLDKLYIDDDINLTKTSNLVKDSALEMAESISQQHQAGIESKIWMVSVDVNAKFNTSNKIEGASKERYEYYYYEMIRRKIVLQMTTSEIRKHLNPTFEAELKAIDSKDDAITLFEKYGTHLMTGYLLGGRLEATNYRTYTSEYSSTENNIDLGAKMGIAVGSVSVGASYSFSENYAKHETTDHSTSTYQCSTIGGYGVASMTLDHLFTRHDSMLDGAGNYEYSRWLNALNQEKNLEILGISNGGQAIEVWDLLPQTSEYNNARRIMHEAYMELCGDKYESYCEMYKSFAVIGTDNATGTVDGYYQNTTSTNGTYIVDTNLIKLNQTHFDGMIYNAVYPGAEIFMNWSLIDNSTKRWNIVSGENYVEILDEENGVFKVGKGTENKTFTVQLEKCVDVGADKWEKVNTIEFEIKPMKYSGGLGTENNPYIISTADDMIRLAATSDDFNKHFVMANDIDYTGKTPERMIGNEENPFTGTFDGNLCTIRNYNIASSDTRDVGIFGDVQKGTIKNLRVEDSKIISKNTDLLTAEFVCVGIIAGETNGKIINCSVKNCVIEIEYSGKSNNNLSNNSGGVIGAIRGGTVSNCSSVDNVVRVEFKNDSKQDVTSLVGGFAGHSDIATIDNCYVYYDNSSNKTYLSSKMKASGGGANHLGGFIGDADGTTIEYCVAYAPSALKGMEATSTSVGSKIGSFLGNIGDRNAKLSNNVVKRVYNIQEIGNGVSLNSTNMRVMNKFTYDDLSYILVGSGQWVKDSETQRAVLGSMMFTSGVIVEGGRTTVEKGTPLSFSGATPYIQNALYESHKIKVFTLDKGGYNYSANNGTYNLKIHACGKVTDYNITVDENLIKEGLFIESSPKTVYIAGEAFSTDGITITYVNKDGIKKNVDINDVEIYGPDRIIEGKNTYVFAYNGYKMTAILEITGTQNPTSGGNINGDSSIDKDDLVAFLQYLHFGKEVNADLDLNSDGAIDAQDILILKKVIDCYNEFTEKTNKINN